MRIASTLLGLTLLFPAGAALAQDPAPQPAPEGDQPRGEDEGTREGDREGTRESDRPGERDGRRRGQRGRNRSFGALGDVERLKEELGLSAEQVKQIEDLQGVMREQMQKMREEMREGGFDPRAMRDKFRAAREEVEGKLDTILTPEQREKLKGLRERMQRDRRGRGRGREELGRRLREEAVKALALTTEEQAVVLPLLDAVFETRKLLTQEQERRRQELLEKVRSAEQGEELAKLLEEYRAAREADKAQLTLAQNQLREVLTVEQEAKLVGLNVLD